jgi:hypothetical protein
VATGHRGSRPWRSCTPARGHRSGMPRTAGAQHGAEPRRTGPCEHGLGSDAHAVVHAEPVEALRHEEAAVLVTTPRARAADGAGRRDQHPQPVEGGRRTVVHQIEQCNPDLGVRGARDIEYRDECRIRTGPCRRGRGSVHGTGCGRHGGRRRGRRCRGLRAQMGAAQGRAENHSGDHRGELRRPAARIPRARYTHPPHHPACVAPCHAVPVIG